MADRKAYLIKEQWCDGNCYAERVAADWPVGETVVIGANQKDHRHPSRAMDPSSQRVVYKGRIDAVLGMCGGARLTPKALELLNAPDEEIARLKREYVPRRPN